MPQPHELTVIIPVKDDPLLFACIASIDVVCNVLIVLNSAPKTYKTSVQETYRNESHIEVLISPVCGLGANYNFAIQHCKTEYILLMDSDCRFSKNTIMDLLEGLSDAPLSKGVVEFDSHNYLSSIVARHRYFNTSSFINAYSPPLAFSKSVLKHHLEYFFHEGLHWAEDLDFDYRIQKASLRIAHRPKATIIHKSLTPSQDLKAAYNYGKGYAQGVLLGLYPEVKAFTSDVQNKYHSYYQRVKAQESWSVGVYGLWWLKAYREGYRDHMVECGHAP